MLLVRDYVDEIVRDCFSQWDKDVLEIHQNERVITLRDQFLYHYETACYDGSLDSLKKAIMYKIFLHQDLLLKISDYRQNIQRILDLGEYSKVTLGYKDQLGTETNIGASGSKTESLNIQADKFTGVDQSETLAINDERTATSQSNLTEGLQVVLPQPTITSGETPTINTFTTGDTVVLKEQEQFTKKTLNNPQPKEASPIGYQNLTKDISTNENHNTNTTLTSRGAESKNKSTFATSNTNTKGTRMDEVSRKVMYTTNQARLKMWKTELPKLQVKFWACFFNLFSYEPL